MKTRTKVIMFGLVALFFLLIVKWVYGYYFVPGVLDDFAKCLSEKGAVMYGAMEWCHFTQQQRGMFGKSFKFLNYREYAEFPQELGKIHKTPTWVVNGQAYENVQSFDRLSHLTNCSLPQ